MRHLYPTLSSEVIIGQELGACYICGEPTCFVNFSFECFSHLGACLDRMTEDYWDAIKGTPPTWWAQE